ncbi:hypothetical protein PG985_016009 [Apiospora marii]|uniref:uncharacterized protein n=1 Tax=Apiospora marii TaxID=335849 RepID=UPI0031325ABB
MPRPQTQLPRLLPRPSQARPAEEDPPEQRPRKRQLVVQACENRLGLTRANVAASQCDGVRPRCARCVKRGDVCEWAPEKHAHGREDAKYRGVVELLRERSQAESAQVLQRIREADSLQGAVNTIAEAQLLLRVAPTAAPWHNEHAPLQRSPAPQSFQRPTRRRLGSPYDDDSFMFEKQFMVDAKDRYLNNDMFVDLPSQDLPLSRWTHVSNDDRLMNHLLRMLFTWDNIVERTLYRPILEEDIASMNPTSAGDDCRSFCTRFLISALLAASCLYTMDPTTFKDPGNSMTRGQRWADEASALLAEIDKPSIPLIQGLLALFVYEGNLGQGAKALPYLMRAEEVYGALNKEKTLRSRAGVDEARAQRERQAALGLRKPARRPCFPKVWREPDFPMSLPDSKDYWWSRYPMSIQMQRSMKVETREADAALSEIVEETLDFIYPSEDGVPPVANPQRALELYRAIVDWRFSCPSRIRLEEAVLPSAILLHVAAELMLTAILRPFAQTSRAQFGASFDPRERCLAHASSMVSAIWAFRAFAHVRFEYWLTHPLGWAAYLVVGGGLDDDAAPVQMDTLARACQCLHEMRAHLPLAADVLCGVQAAFKRCGQPVPAFLGRYFDAGLRHRRDGLMHRAVAPLLPGPAGGEQAAGGAELQLQELLDGLDDMGID